MAKILDLDIREIPSGADQIILEGVDGTQRASAKAIIDVVVEERFAALDQGLATEVEARNIAIAEYVGPVIEELGQRLRIDAKATPDDMTGTLPNDIRYMAPADIKRFMTRADRPMDVGHFAMQNSVVIDRLGRAGGGPAAYVPLSAVYVSAPILTINAGYDPANLTSSEMPGHVKFTLPNASPEDACLIYFNTVTSRFHAAIFPNLPNAPGGFIAICTVWQGGEVAYNGTRVISFDDWRLGPQPWKSISAIDYEIVVDRQGIWGGGANKLYVPRRFTTFQGDKFPTTDFTDIANPECPERAGYCKFDLSTENYILDTLIFDKDERSWKVVPFSDLHANMPPVQNSGLVVAKFFREQITSEFPVRRSTDGLMENHNPYGRADMARMPFVFQTTPTFSAITDPALTALGFTIGQAETPTGFDRAPYSGMPFAQKMRGGRAFFRFYAQISEAGKWGSPVVFFWNDAAYVAQSFDLRVERELSPTARIYSGSIVLPGADVTRYLIGLSVASGGAIQKVTGIQHHASNTPAHDILQSDFGALRREPMIGPDLFLVSSETLPIYRDNLFLEREGPEPTVTLASSKGRPYQPLVIGEGGGDLIIDPARLGSTARLSVRASEEKTVRNWRNLNCHVRNVPLESVASPTILGLGDSITNRETLEMARRYLAQWNIAPNFIGTMKSAINEFDDNADGPLGEGREGWAAWNTYLGYDIAPQAPGGAVAVGDEAAYLALNKYDKRARQVFLNPNTSAGSAAPVVAIGGTSYRFDLAFYLSRFGLAVPDIIILNLGMNDFFQTTPANYKIAIGAIIAEARRAAPNAKIICWQTGLPASREGNHHTAAAFGQIRRALIEVVEARRAVDANLFLVSAWVHQSVEAWETFAPAANAAGVRADQLTEYVHPKGIVREQHAFALACAIANLI